MPINSVPVRQEVTAETLRILYNNCPALRWIKRDKEKYFQESTPIGSTLQIKRPWKPVGRKGQAFQPEPIVQTTVPLVISYWRGCDYIFNDTDEALYLDMENFHAEYSRPIGIMLANQIESDLLSYMQVTIPNFVGTPGTMPNTTATYNSAQTKLNKLLAPQEDRGVIFNSDFNQNLVGLGQTIFNPAREISDQYLTGYVGKYASFKFAIDEQLPGFTVATYAGTPVTNGANQMGSSISIRGWNSGSTTLNPGDRLTFTGVYAVNPQGTRQPYIGTPFQCVVTQTVSDTTGTLTAQIYPPLIPSGGQQNAYVSTNIGGGLPDGTSVTVAGASGTACQTAFAIHPNAYTAAFLKLMKPKTAESEVMGGDEAGTPGVYMRSLRQWQSSGPYAGYETERADVIYGFCAQYADYFSCVIYGASS